MNAEDLRKLAYGVGFMRTAIGVVAVVAPGLAMKMWLDADPASKKVKAMGLAVGARDVVLGLGTIQALQGQGVPATWLRFGALADTADGIGTIRAFGPEPRNPRILISLMALGFAAIGWLLSRQEELAEAAG